MNGDSAKAILRENSSASLTSENNLEGALKSESLENILDDPNAKKQSEDNSAKIQELNDEITLYSNEYYISINEKDKSNVKGFPYMVKWNYSQKDDKFIIINKENDNEVLCIEKNNNNYSLKIKIGNENNQNCIFEFIDIDIYLNNNK